MWLKYPNIFGKCDPHYRGCTWQHSHCRALRGLYETLPGVPEGTFANPSCGSRECPSVPQRHLWEGLHWPQTPEVSKRISLFLLPSHTEGHYYVINQHIHPSLNVYLIHFQILCREATLTAEDAGNRRHRWLLSHYLDLTLCHTCQHLQQR